MSAVEVQALLRFLTKDAKIPLAEAMAKISALRKHEMNTASAIAEADLNIVKDIFIDEKQMKQVLNAAKRSTNPKKRSTLQTDLPPTKRSKANEQNSPHNLEAELALPMAETSVEELETVQIETNRAPLVLAFAVVVLEFTMPDQPLSSRLSLAHAVVGVTSRTKAKSIGLVSGATAEEEGWARGQPKMKILGREIAVMRRQMQPTTINEESSQETIKGEESISHEAFWGLDIEALRRSNGPLVAGKLAGSQGPPIHTPQTARSYLLKSISCSEKVNDTGEPITTPKRKRSAIEIAAAKERAAAMLLKSIRLVCESWASTLSVTDLDRRAWSWYSSVRPDVAQGQSGWGQRGKVSLADILKLRRV